MADIPNLAGKATDDLIEQVGGSFKASYINWSRTLHLLREHAPGWLPEAVQDANSSILHRAPLGGYLSIRFRHADGTVTPEVPQAVMDNRNAAIPFDKITARDITDTHRRGACMAAALTFGLAYELWAKIPLESGYGEQAEPEPEPVRKITPTNGVIEAIGAERMTEIRGIADIAREYLDTDDIAGAREYLHGLSLPSEEQIAVLTFFKSYERAAMKKHHDGDEEGAIEHLTRNREKENKSTQRKAA